MSACGGSPVVAWRPASAWIPAPRPVGLREFQEEPQVSTRPKIQCSDSHGPRLPSENPPQGQQ